MYARIDASPLVEVHVQQHHEVGRTRQHEGLGSRLQGVATRSGAEVEVAPAIVAVVVVVVVVVVINRVATVVQGIVLQREDADEEEPGSKGKEAEESERSSPARLFVFVR